MPEPVPTAEAQARPRPPEDGRSTTFLEERRRRALEAYESEPVPTWRRSGFWTTSLRRLELDSLEPRRYDAVDELPQIVREHLGDEEHSALIVQRGASVVYAHCEDPSITVAPLEQAAAEHPELVEPWLGKRLPVDEGKFAAANAAFWTGGLSSTCRRTYGSRSRSRSST